MITKDEMKEGIRDLRRRHGITQQQLADSLYGVKVQSVASWESGRRGCPPIIYWVIKMIWDNADLREEG